ncbi:hypothetical protein BDV06DRAFT_224592 [Aspergillus oleicola]
MVSELVRLANTISHAVATLEASHYRDNGSVTSYPTEETAAANCTAVSACMELLDRLQGPLNRILPLWNGAPLQAISRFQIAKYVPLTGDISYRDLSRESNVPGQQLKQFIRFAIVYHGLFEERRKGFVAHSAGSLALLQYPDAMAGLAQIDEWFGVFSRTVDATTQFPGYRSNESGYALTHDNQSLFEHLSAKPEKAKQFAEAMQFFTVAIPEASPHFLVTGYPWADLPTGSTVVDVGGHNGTIARLLAQQNKHIKIVVQDLPYAAEIFAAAATEATEQEQPHDVSFHAADFFTPQTIVADIYLFRWTLMNWSDNDAVLILRALVPALRPGAKVLVHESLCPKGTGELPLSTERYIRWMNMLMLGVYKSQLRDEEEWRELFKQADTRFQCVSCWRVPGSALGFVQAVWEEGTHGCS